MILQLIGYLSLPKTWFTQKHAPSIAHTFSTKKKVVSEERSAVCLQHFHIMRTIGIMAKKQQTIQQKNKSNIKIFSQL